MHRPDSDDPPLGKNRWGQDEGNDVVDAWFKPLWFCHTRTRPMWTLVNAYLLFLFALDERYTLHNQLPGK